MKTYYCPLCFREMSPEEINEEKGEAFCRSCEKTFHLAQCEDSGVNSLLLPDKLTVMNAPQGIKMFRYRLSHWFGAFLLAMGVFSLVTSVIVGVVMLESGESWMLLVLAPFLLMEGGLFAAGLALLMGKVQMVLAFGNGKGSCFTGLGRWGKNRDFVYGPDSVIKLEKNMVHSKHGSREVTNILIRSLGGNECRIGAFLSDEAKRYLVRELVIARNGLAGNEPRP